MRDERAPEAAADDDDVVVFDLGAHVGAIAGSTRAGMSVPSVIAEALAHRLATQVRKQAPPSTPTTHQVNPFDGSHRSSRLNWATMTAATGISRAKMP